MPNQDGSLTAADTVTLNQVLNRIIPSESTELGAGTIGILDDVEKRSSGTPATRSAFLRIVEAMSLDMMSHAVGGFAALTADEQIASIQNVEATLPEEFAVVLGLARDVYYEREQTPARPKSFDTENEIFGKVKVEAEPVKTRPSRRRNRK
jgi:hypothetical protein